MMVRLFSATTCNLCWATEKRLIKNETPFEKILLDQDEAARQKLIEAGYAQGTQLPVVVVEDGGEVVDSWTGFLVTRIDALKEQP